MSETQKERRERWRQLVAQQERSGLSVRVFCRQLLICIDLSVAKRRKRYRHKSAETVLKDWL